MLTGTSAALPTRPLASIALMDADAESALAFVKSKLLLAGVTEELQSEELEQIKRLGGRAGDLEVVSPYILHLLTLPLICRVLF